MSISVKAQVAWELQRNATWQLVQMHLENNTGSENTAVGRVAMNANTSGTQSAAFR